MNSTSKNTVNIDIAPSATRYRVFDCALKAYQKTPSGSDRRISPNSSSLAGTKHRVCHDTKVIYINEVPATTTRDKSPKKAVPAPKQAPAPAPEPTVLRKSEWGPETNFNDFAREARAHYDVINNSIADLIPHITYFSRLANETDVCKDFIEYYLDSTRLAMEIIESAMEKKSRSYERGAPAKDRCMEIEPEPSADILPVEIPADQPPKPKPVAIPTKGSSSSSDDCESPRAQADPGDKMVLDQADDVPANVTPIDEAIDALKKASRYVSGAHNTIKDTKTKLAELVADRESNHRHTIHRKLSLNVSLWLGRYDGREQIYAMDLMSAIDETNRLYTESFAPAESPRIEEDIPADIPNDSPDVVRPQPLDKNVLKKTIHSLVMKMVEGNCSIVQRVQHIDNQTKLYTHLTAHVGSATAMVIVDKLYGRGEHLSNLVHEHSMSMLDDAHRQAVYDIASGVIVDRLGLPNYGSEVDVLIAELTKLSNELAKHSPGTIENKLVRVFTSDKVTTRTLLAAIG